MANFINDILELIASVVRYFTGDTNTPNSASASAYVPQSAVTKLPQQENQMGDNTPLNAPKTPHAPKAPYAPKTAYDIQSDEFFKNLKTAADVEKLATQMKTYTKIDNVLRSKDASLVQLIKENIPQNRQESFAKEILKDYEDGINRYNPVPTIVKKFMKEICSDVESSYVSRAQQYLIKDLMTYATVLAEGKQPQLIDSSPKQLLAYKLAEYKHNDKVPFIMDQDEVAAINLTKLDDLQDFISKEFSDHHQDNGISVLDIDTSSDALIAQALQNDDYIL